MRRVDLAINPLDGARIAYRSFGAGPAVVLVHGTALSQVIWRGFGYVRDLSVDHTVITLDLRGHGRSDKPQQDAGYTMDLFVADVIAVLDAVQVERAHYVGYSLGGRLGFSLADAYPERVLGFVSAAGAPGNTPGAFDRVFFPGCVAVLETGGMPGFLAAWQRHAGGPLDKATRAAFAQNDATALAAYMRQADRDLGIPDERLAGLKARTLMLVGSEDAERLAAAEHVQAVAPHATMLVVRGAGHADVLRRAESLTAVRAHLVP